jgi:hypothetical protein
LLRALLLAPGLGSALVAAEGLGLLQVETDDLRLLHFDPQQTYLVPHTGRSFHNSMEFQRWIFQWKPWDARTTVLLQDFTDSGNASATAAPVNLVTLDVAPPAHAFETLPGSERIYSAMNHELVHVAQGDAWNSTDARWRRLFAGKVTASTGHPESLLYAYLSAPRTVTPRWFNEGAAVFLETWMSGGVGRAQGAWDEMVFRAMVRDDAHFYSNLGIVAEGTRVDFLAGANAYLYGTRFISWLALTWSPQHVIDWIRRSEDSERYYARQFRKVFGVELEAAWDQWIAFEHEFQRANLEQVRRFPLTRTRPLAASGLGSVSRAFVDAGGNALVGGFRYPGVVAHVGSLSLSDGMLERHVDIKGPLLYTVTSSAFDPQSRTFFFTADNNALRDLMSYDLATGRTRLLLEDARIGDIVFDSSDRSLWGLRHLDGYVTLVRIPYPYDRWTQVHTWPYGEVPFELDVSRDGALLSCSMERLDGSHRLEVFRTGDLEAGRVEPFAHFDFGVAIPEGFVFSTDARFLYGSSYYTGISNIFRFEIGNGAMEAVSNAETGFFRPIPREDGSLIVFEYTGSGFVPGVLEDPRPLQDLASIRFLGNEVITKHPVLKDWAVGSPAKVAFDDMVESRGEYRPLRELDLVSAYPIAEGYDDGLALGWSFRIQDPILLNSLNVDLSHSLGGGVESDEQLHADVEYHYADWRLRYWHNDADFYDLFGPTERSRKGDAVILGYEHALIYDTPRRLDLDASVASYTGLDTLPGNQNVDSGFEDLLSAHVALKYTHTWKSLGAVDQEKGLRWELGSYVDRAEGETVPRYYGGLDVGTALPWRNSSLWLYSGGGTSDGNRESSLANWYFGAYGNNYVDDGEIKRYRELTAFPGFEIDEIEGQDFAKAVLEWNITPIYFEEAGTPAVYLSWLRPAVFAGALMTDPGNRRYEETWYNAGFQLDLEFTVVHRLPLTLSVGYAEGYVDGNKRGDEWMVSLKLM